MVKNPPANAGDTGFNPWSRKITFASEQLSLCTRTIEPGKLKLLKLGSRNPCCPREAIAMGSPHTAKNSSLSP